MNWKNWEKMGIGLTISFVLRTEFISIGLLEHMIENASCEAVFVLCNSTFRRISHGAGFSLKCNSLKYIQLSEIYCSIGKFRRLLIKTCNRSVFFTGTPSCDLKKER